VFGHILPITITLFPKDCHSKKPEICQEKDEAEPGILWLPAKMILPKNLRSFLDFSRSPSHTSAAFHKSPVQQVFLSVSASQREN
jgi:hypothetical protein